MLTSVSKDGKKVHIIILIKHDNFQWKLWKIVFIINKILLLLHSFFEMLQPFQEHSVANVATFGNKLFCLKSCPI